ncbi:MAG: asparaginase [Actinomycetota bacterium]
MTATSRFGGEDVAPIAVARRSGFDESIHHGAGVVVDADGAVLSAIGDPSLVVYLRSSLKAFQAEAMVRHGLDLPAHLLALVTASHSGEPRHLDGVVELLSMHGLGVDDLANTPTLPYGAEARRAADRAGAEPRSLFQNCSGKHAGMLATCVVNGWPTEGYLSADHPVQEAIAATIADLGAPVRHVGVDGCGAPTHALALDASARALGGLVRTASVVPTAMRAHPDQVGGTGRDVTEWMRLVPGLVAKDGAQGVMALALGEGEHRGRACVFKIADGSDEARRAVVPAALEQMGVDVEAARGRGDALRMHEVEVLGGGEPVGSIDALPWS